MSVLSQYGRVLPFLRPYRREFAIVAALGLVAALTSLAQPWLTRDLIDQALLRKDWDALVRVAGLLILVTVIGFALNALSSYWYTKMSAGALFDMRLALFRHLQTLGPAFYSRTKTGDIVSRLNNDLGEVQRVTADAMLSILSSALFLAGSVAIMLWLDWRLFLVGVAVLPFSVFAVRIYQARLAARTSDLRQRSADLGSFLIESLLGVRLVVAYAREDDRAAEFRGFNNRFVDSLLKLQLMSYWAGAVPGALIAVSTSAVFLYGGKQVIDGALSVGGLMAFLAYHARLLGPVQNLMSIYGSLVTGAVSLGRVNELLDERPSVVEPAVARPLPDSGEIEFRGVAFQFRGAPVLDSCDFALPANRLTVLMGPSGAGKSTIADLLCRLHDPAGGAILFGGVDLREFPLKDLRRAVAVVDQLPFLFHSSIRDNLRFAKPDATDADLWDVLQLAQIDGFVRTLPQSLDTIAGERGASLSAGERQRIALARVLLCDPKVLVLDEPTSALDSATERGFAASLRQIARNRTVLVITHRPELAMIADQLLALRDGKVRQSAHAHASRGD